MAFNVFVVYKHNYASQTVSVWINVFLGIDGISKKL